MYCLCHNMSSVSAPVLAELLRSYQGEHCSTKARSKCQGALKQRHVALLRAPEICIDNLIKTSKDQIPGIVNSHLSRQGCRWNDARFE